MSLVLDASVTVAYVHADETTDAVLQVFDSIAQQGAWVPSLWRAETANVLQVQVRKRRYAADKRDRFLQQLGSFLIRVDAMCDVYAWTTTLSLSEKYGLTTYDASYLELAVRRQLPLATLDRDLRAAATAEGVPLLGL